MNKIKFIPRQPRENGYIYILLNSWKFLEILGTFFAYV